MHLHNNTTQQYPDIPVHKQTQYPDTICTQYAAHTETETNKQRYMQHTEQENTETEHNAQNSTENTCTTSTQNSAHNYRTYSFDFIV